jgi:alpha-tubulin suppressor-like RCC1 family protein
MLGALVGSLPLLLLVGVPSASAGEPPSGSLYTWGLNSSYQLGDGTMSVHRTPEAIALPAGVSLTAVTAGDDYGLAIGSDGMLYGWGDNYGSALGDGTANPQVTPEAITLAPGVSPLAITTGDDHSMAIGSDGNLYSWGDNSDGDLGDGTGSGTRQSPEVITLAAGVTPTAISAGGDHSMAIGSDGKLYTWGYNNDGQLGNGSYDPGPGQFSPEPIVLAPGVSPTAIAAGADHSLAIGSDGKVYAWGRNDFGQVGDGDPTEAPPNRPEAIPLAQGVTPTAIAAGSYDSFAIGSDGKLYDWGYNVYGQLGDGTYNPVTTPEAVTLASGVSPTAISGGADHTLAIGSDGNLYAWGLDGAGELGDGGFTYVNSPEEIAFAPGAIPIAVAAGQEFSMAIGTSGPAPNLPETPLGLALPLTAATLIAGAWVLSRRRHLADSKRNKAREGHVFGLLQHFNC